MHKLVKRILLVLVALVVLTAGVFSWALYSIFSNMKSEYVTAGVIHDLNDYVTAHPRSWPKTWSDLGNGDDWSEYTRFRFDLDYEAVLRKPDSIYDAVTPVSGKYFTYPHAKGDLERVLTEMKRVNEIRNLSIMRVVTVDKNGNQIGAAEWVDVPEPDHFAHDGFSHIENYVVRMLASTARFTSIIIGTPDKKIAISLWKNGTAAEFVLSVDRRSDAARESAVRKFFAERKLAISHDYIAGNGDDPEALRCLGYFLPSDAKSITSLTQECLRRIYGLKDEVALDFAYDESEAAKPR